MNENQPVTVGILKKVLSKELAKNSESIKHELTNEIVKHGESLKQELKSEIVKHGGLLKQELKKEINGNGTKVKSDIRKEFRTELRKSLKEQERRIGRHLNAVYGDFESKQAIMAENITELKNDLENVKEDIGIMKEDIEYIKLDINLIRHDLKNKVSRDELANKKAIESLK